MIKTLGMLAALAFSAAAAAPAAPADHNAGTKDREQIIDVEKLAVAVRQSTEPLYKALSDTRLQERFETVRTLLRREKVSKEALVGALTELKSGIDAFTGQWESVVEPLWAGQAALGDAIDRIRRKVPPEGTSDVPLRIQRLMDGYDQRLHELADRINAAQDPVAKTRMKKLFQNLLSLRRFTEQLGRAGVEKTKVRLMLRTVQILARLQDQLMDATFELEKVRSILAGESDFIADYVELLQMARTASDLAGMLREMRQDGKGIGGLVADAGKVRQATRDVAEGLEGFSKHILDDLEAELDNISDEMGEAPADAASDAELDVVIQRYSTETVISRRIVVE